MHPNDRVSVWCLLSLFFQSPPVLCNTCGLTPCSSSLGKKHLKICHCNGMHFLLSACLPLPHFYYSWLKLVNPLGWGTLQHDIKQTRDTFVYLKGSCFPTKDHCSRSPSAHRHMTHNHLLLFCCSNLSSIVFWIRESVHPCKGWRGQTGSGELAFCIQKTLSCLEFCWKDWSEICKVLYALRKYDTNAEYYYIIII